MNKKKIIGFEFDIRNSINKYINEELGICSDLKSATERLMFEILLFIKSLKRQTSNIEGVSQKRGFFKIELLNKELTINVIYHDFLNKKYYRENNNKVIDINNSSTDTINITIKAIHGEFEQKTLNDIIFRELEHVFHKDITQKVFYENGLYQYSLNVKNNKRNTNPYAKPFAEVIYLSRKFEQEIYIDKLYTSLMTSGNNVTYTVTHSEIYCAILKLQECLDLILKFDNKDCDLLRVIDDYQPFNYDYNRLVKQTRRAIENLKIKIGKVIIKSKIDFGKRTVETFTHNAQYYTKEEEWENYQKSYHLNLIEAFDLNYYRNILHNF